MKLFQLVTSILPSTLLQSAARPGLLLVQWHPSSSKVQCSILGLSMKRRPRDQAGLYRAVVSWGPKKSSVYIPSAWNVNDWQMEDYKEVSIWITLAENNLSICKGFFFYGLQLYLPLSGSDWKRLPTRAKLCPLDTGFMNKLVVLRSPCTAICSVSQTSTSHNLKIWSW